MPDGSKPDLPAKRRASRAAPQGEPSRAPGKRRKPFVSPYGGLRGTVLHCADLTEPTAAEWVAAKRRR